MEQRRSSLQRRMSAFGTKRTSLGWPNAQWPVLELTPIHFAVCYFEPARCLVLSLGEGDETALQSRRPISQIATPQSGDAKAAQCARVRGPRNGTRATHPRARRGDGVARRNRRDTFLD